MKKGGRSGLLVIIVVVATFRHEPVKRCERRIHSGQLLSHGSSFLVCCGWLGMCRKVSGITLVSAMMNIPCPGVKWVMRGVRFHGTFTRGLRCHRGDDNVSCLR